MTCGNCLNGDQCHHVDGTCMMGCDSGWSGDTCMTGRFFSNQIGATVAQWVKRWPTDLADRVRSSLEVKSTQPYT